MMDSYYRAGGLAWDLPPGFAEAVQSILDILPERIDEYERLLTRNPIWLERTQTIGAISAEQALALSATGPALRATGVPWDLRKTMPYSVYEAFDFEIPVGSRGDVYDRYLVRMEEMRQSLRIIEQALNNLPEGPYQVDDRRITLPPKKGVYTNIEDLMNHFKLVMHGIQTQPGEVYGYSEGGNGELGFYIVSDGSMKPWRIHARGPCFPIFSAFPSLIQNTLLADAVAALGSINIIAGELDK
jgi:NADH:ubiquinone oxidoreductase subunit D